MSYKSKVENLYPLEFEILKNNGRLIDKWANVYDHCKTEAAVALVLSDLLKLSNEERDILAKAAILHDWYKRVERETSVKGVDEYNKAVKDSYDKLLELGVDKRIVDVAHSVGHTSLSGIQATPDFLKKIMHFIDDITHGSMVVGIDKRIDEIEKKEGYKELNESGRVVHNGRTYFEVQREVGNTIREEIEMSIIHHKQIKKGELLSILKNGINKYL